MDRFRSPKSIKMRLMCFCFLLIFYWFFHYFCILDHLMLVLYRFFFRIVFCIVFWSLWGSILESFWEALGDPNRSFLASLLG